MPGPLTRCLAALILACLAVAPAAGQDAAVSDDPSLLAASLEAEQETSYPQLRLYGFADFTFSKFFIEESSLLSYYLPAHSTFSVGNVNVYLDSQISERLRSLVEVRFSFLPNGAQSIDTSTGQLVRISTQVNDYRIVGRSSQWGSLGIERALVSYDLLPALSLSVGRFVTPWGLWNIDHGTPTLINAISPLFIDSQFIPTRQTGLMLNGVWSWPAWRAGYYLTLSNGRGPVDTYRDFDENKAVGGRLFVSSSGALGDATLGFTFYFGDDTNPDQQFVRLPANGGKAYIETVHRTKANERALAADLKWEVHSFLLAAEFVVAGRSYDEDARTLVTQGQTTLAGDGRLQFSPDSLRYGGYVLLGYRFQWLGVMPFAHVEYNQSGSEQPVSPKLLSAQLGLNIRPEAGLVLKLVGALIYFPGAEPRVFGDDPTIFAFNAQAAWAF